MTRKNNSLGNLNQIAFCKSEGNTVLQAGPGTGKTYSIQIAIEYFFKTLPNTEEKQCLAITFTNNAANELRGRINRLIDIYTFHAFAREVIYLNDGFYPNIITDADILAVMKDISIELNLDIKDRELYDNIKREPEGNKEALELYTRKKNNMFVMDFDDLLIEATAKLNNNLNLLGYSIVFVDETQDVSQLQLHLLYAMQKQYCGIIFKFVGDPNQSIMGFSGAVRDVMSILAVSFDAKVMQLNETFRSCPEIVDVYKDFAIKPVTNLITHNMSKGNVRKLSFYNDSQEAEFIVKTIKTLPEGTTVGILTRTRPYLPKIEAALVTASIPCNNVGSISFYKFAEISLLMAWLKLYLNCYDTISGMKVITNFQKVGKKTGENMLLKYKDNPALVPILYEPMQIIENAHKDGLDTKGILEGFFKKFDFWSMKAFKNDDNNVKATRQQRLKEFIEDGTDVKLEQFVYNILSTTEKTDRIHDVSLYTIHSSKGLEFDVVFLVGFEDGILPHFRSQTSYEIEQERCLAFVGLSRARHNMYITQAANRYLFGQTKQMQQSIWWKDIVIRDKIDVKSAEINDIDLNPDKVICSWICDYCDTKNDVFEEFEGDFSAKIVNDDGTKDRLCFCSNCRAYIQLVKVA